MTTRSKRDQHQMTAADVSKVAAALVAVVRDAEIVLPMMRELVGNGGPESQARKLANTVAGAAHAAVILDALGIDPETPIANLSALIPQALSRLVVQDLPALTALGPQLTAMAAEIQKKAGVGAA
jgi:hypothetical protein